MLLTVLIKVLFIQPININYYNKQTFANLTVSKSNYKLDFENKFLNTVQLFFLIKTCIYLANKHLIYVSSIAIIVLSNDPFNLTITKEAIRTLQNTTAISFTTTC